MRKFLSEVAKSYQSDDAFKGRVDKFQRALKSEEWLFFITLCMAMKNHMATGMFKPEYTKLSAEEKDIIQRTFANMNELLDFFMSPLGWFQKKGKFQIAAKRFMPDLKKKDKA
jgi:hypothetical protein